LQVNDVEFDIIDDFATLSDNQVISKWRKRHDVVAIEDALGGMREWRKKNYLSPRHPAGLSYPVPEDELEEIVDSKMEQMILNITEKCNLRCRYCVYTGTYELERRHSSKSMPLEIAKKAVDLFKYHSRKSEKAHIAFYGGEPFTCYETIRHINDHIQSLGKWRKLYLHIDTNGTLFTDEMIRFLIDNEYFLQISIDGPLEVHDRNRVFANGRGTFTRIMKNIERFRNINKEYFDTNVAVAITIAPPYDLVTVKEYFDNSIFKRNVFSTNMIDRFDTTFFKKFTSDSPSLLKPTIRKLHEHYMSSRIDGKNPSNFTRALLERGMTDLCRREICLMGDRVYPNGICVPGVRRVFVSADGFLYPCEKAIGDDFIIGHVDRGLEIERVRGMIDRYIAESNPDCVDCWALRLCKMCFYSMKRGDRMDIERKRERCVDQRQSAHNQLEMYTKILEQNNEAFEFVKDMVFE
jgi:uncharacterized protein